MRGLRRVVLGASIALAACTETAPLYPSNAPRDVVAACELTQRKCTACHDKDRIVTARYSAEEWRETVEEMRLLPGSTITAAERDIILRCLLPRATSASGAVHPRCFVAER
jgi:hypothetical protein